MEDLDEISDGRHRISDDQRQRRARADHLTNPGGPSSSSTRIVPPLPVEHYVRPSALRTRPCDVAEEDWNNINKKQKKEAIQQSREAASDAAVAKVFSLSAKRAIIEFNCSDESKIGEFSKDDPDCVVYRFTEKEDMMFDSGLEHAQHRRLYPRRLARPSLGPPALHSGIALAAPQHEAQRSPS